MRHLAIIAIGALGVGCGTVGLDPFTGVEGPRLDIIPEGEEVHFETTPADGSESYEEIILLSAGDESIKVEEIYLEGVDADEFEFANDLPVPLELAPDGEMPVLVIFHPTAIGTFRTELVIGAGDWQISRTLTGEGCEPDGAGDCDELGW